MDRSEIAALLRSLEDRGTAAAGGSACPACRAPSRLWGGECAGHRPDCPLARALAELEGEEACCRYHATGGAPRHECGGDDAPAREPEPSEAARLRAALVEALRIVRFTEGQQHAFSWHEWEDWKERHAAALRQVAGEGGE